MVSFTNHFPVLTSQWPFLMAPNWKTQFLLFLNSSGILYLFYLPYSMLILMIITWLFVASPRLDYKFPERYNYNIFRTIRHTAPPPTHTQIWEENAAVILLLPPVNPLHRHRPSPPPPPPAASQVSYLLDYKTHPSFPPKYGGVCLIVQKCGIFVSTSVIPKACF